MFDYSRNDALAACGAQQAATTNVIERCFVEVGRRTRPMVCFINMESVDRIIYSLFLRFNLEWKNRTLKLFTQAV